MRAYLPNPGRLHELFLPEAKLFLVQQELSQGRKIPYLVVAVERDGLPVMLHTHANNLVARHLVEQNKVPGLEGAVVLKAEHAIGHSRFDFLLRREKRDVVLEVKPCTLFGNKIAMFPDAVTARGKRHLLELAGLAGSGMATAVLFVVHSPRPRYFMPDYHTDLEFSRTLLAVRDRVMIRAMAVEWKSDLSLGSSVRELLIPWDIIEREAQESLLLKNLEEIKGKIVKMKGKASEKGSLFSAIHKKEIVEAMSKQHHVEITEEFIMLEKPIKEIGEFEIPIEVKDKKSSFKLIVEKI